MINPPYKKTCDGLFKISDLDCVDYSALVASWVLEQRLNNGSPVYIVSINTKTWGHTVCEIKGVGTLDGKNNLFIPNYFYHKQPITEDQFNNAKPVFNWYNIQKKSTKSRKWYFYNRDEITYTSLQLFGDYTCFSTME